MNRTETLANYAVQARFEQFPGEVILRAKHCILDSVGCALGGAQMELGRKYARMARKWGGNPESTIMGDGARVSFLSAAYTNAVLCVALDFDDTYLWALSHPGGPVIQAALPTAEMISASGKALITAVIIGYEISMRIGRALRATVTNNEIRRVLFSSAYTVFGAATSVGKLLGLSEDGIVGAFGIAANSTPGTPRGTWSGGPPAQQGEAKLAYQMHALIGTFSAWQAANGPLGPPDVFDGDLFWTVAGSDFCDYRELTDGLGEKYRIMEVGFKAESSCRLAHGSTTATREAIRGDTWSADEIEEIVLTEAALLTPTYEWETVIEAQFSLPCAVALTVAGGEPGLGWYEGGRFKDPDIRQLAQKVKLVEDVNAAAQWIEHGKLVSTAEVKTSDGAVKKAYIEYPKGEPENQIAEDQLLGKFMGNASGILGEKRAQELLDKLVNLEEVQDVSVLSQLLRS